MEFENRVEKHWFLPDYVLFCLSLLFQFEENSKKAFDRFILFVLSCESEDVESIGVLDEEVCASFNEGFHYFKGESSVLGIDLDEAVKRGVSIRVDHVCIGSSMKKFFKYLKVLVDN